VSRIIDDGEYVKLPIFKFWNIFRFVFASINFYSSLYCVNLVSAKNQIFQFFIAKVDFGCKSLTLPSVDRN